MEKGKTLQNQKWLKKCLLVFLLSLFWILCMSRTKADTVTKVIDVNKTYSAQELFGTNSSINVRFTLPSKGRFWIQMENCTNPSGYLFRMGYIQIDGKYASANLVRMVGTESIKSSFLSCDPGTYSLEIRGGVNVSSQTTFSIKFDSAGTYFGEVEGNDSFETANKIQTNVVYQGSYTYSREHISGDTPIVKENDKDYYSFELSSPSKIDVSISGKGDDEPIYIIYREDENGNIQQIAGVSGSYTYRLPKGKYYIEVPLYSGKCYYYELLVKETKESADLFEQEYNDLSSQANPKNVNQWYTGNLNNVRGGDNDWYSFDVPVRSYLAPELRASREEYGIQVLLYDAALQARSKIQSKEDAYYKGEEKLLEPGRYYICVQGSDNTGSDYSIRLSQREYVELTGISLPSSKQMTISQADVLKPTFVPANASEQAVTWKSSDTKVVTVDAEGRISAKGKGTAIITVQSKHNGNILAECRITVKERGSSTSNPSTTTKAKLNKTQLKITVGASSQLRLSGTSDKVTWKSSNKSVAYVYSNGKVKGKKSGKATISATAGGRTYRCTVTVLPKKQKITYAKNLKSKSVTLRWQKTSAVKGYQIRYSTDKRFRKGGRTVTISRYRTYKKNITRLQKGKTYYFKVRSYGTYNGYRLYGAYSNVVKVKIRK